MDLTSRMLASLATEHLGQPVIVMNKPGASGTVMTNEIAASKPDGYTLGTCTMGPFLISPFIRDVKYDALKSFEPLLGFTAAPYGICVLQNAPWNTFKELIDFAKKNPGELSMSSPGMGDPSHIAFEWIAKQENIQWKHVPYPGGAPAAAALLGGHVKAHLGTGSHSSFLESGKFKLLASYSENRNSRYPDIPTLKELGYDVPATHGFYFINVPVGVPEPVLKTLEDAFGNAAKSVSFKAFLKTVIMEAEFKNREQLKKLIGSEYGRWGEIIEKVGMRIK